MSQAAGKILVLIGVVIATVGLLAWLAPGSLRWVGRLPGDVRSDHFAFPIVTCLVVSVLATIVLNLIVRLFR
jgi:Kef-type K+ transport system membrane component KefB